MQKTIQIDWDYLEVEEEDWANLVDIPADENADRPQRRTHRRAWIGILTLWICAMAIVGFRLWLQAEKGARQIEREVGALAQMETVAIRKFKPQDLSSISVESVRVNASGAMVRLVVTETVASGETFSRLETRFYRPTMGKWQRSEPLPSFWGAADELESGAIHFDFYKLDRPYVAAIAEPLDSYNRSLRSLLGLPTQHITITVVPRQVLLGSTTLEGAVMQSSPILYTATTESERTAKLLRFLRSVMASRAIEEVIRYNHIPPNWMPLVSYLHEWIVIQGEHLSDLQESQPEHGQQPRNRCTPSLLDTMLSGNTEDYYHSPGYAEYRTTALSNSAYAFFDCLVFCGQIDKLPALLNGFGHHDDWTTLAPAVFGVPVGEFTHLWACDGGCATAPLPSP